MKVLLGLVGAGAASVGGVGIYYQVIAKDSEKEVNDGQKPGKTDNKKNDSERQGKGDDAVPAPQKGQNLEAQTKQEEAPSIHRVEGQPNVVAGAEESTSTNDGSSDKSQASGENS